jgi:hypothetical protein
MPHVCAISIALASGCTDLVQLAPDPLGNLVTLDIKPRDSEITITDLAEPPQTVVYHAIGTFSDGSRRDVTDLLTWTVDNAAPGTFLDPGTYSTTNAAAGRIVVTAAADGVVQNASITVIIDAVIVDSEYPPSDTGLFAPDNPVSNLDVLRSPQLLYPTDDTLFPQDIATTLFQFDRGMMNDAFRLSFDTDVLHLVVLTGTDRWDTGAAIQSLLAKTSVGEPITVGIRGASVFDSGNVYSGSNIRIQFSRDIPDGFLYYWSAATNGIMRGSLGATSAGKLYPEVTTCVGCHTTTRDGTVMGMGYGGEKLQTIDVATLTTTIDVTSNIDMGWATFSPDNSLVLVANKGQLTLLDAKTGAPYGSPTGKVNLPVGHYATHPDWAPDGSYVTVAYTAMLPTNMDVKGASIARLRFNAGGTFGPPEILVAATGSDNFYFPKYSPDGRFIAYVHATESAHGAPSAELQMIGETGGIPIQLYEASHRSGMQPDLAGISDTMPTWAPVQGERAWLGFTSARPYGAVLPAIGRGQIWVSAIDLAHAAPNMDPSTAAFWLPCQDVTVLNNNPIWAPSANPTQ